MSAPVFNGAHYIIIIKPAKFIKMLFHDIVGIGFCKKIFNASVAAIACMSFDQFFCPFNNFYQHFSAHKTVLCR